MRYRLRTLLILLAIIPLLVYWLPYLMMLLEPPVRE